MSILNFMYDLANSDIIYYVLILLLVVISLVMIYLMYSQNKELSKHLMEKNNLNNVTNSQAKKFVGEESLDNNDKLLELSDKIIPDHLEYSQSVFSDPELQELQVITKELEENYRDRQLDTNAYEQEQEEDAIISYDELLSKTQTLSTVDIKKADKICDTYVHEENFLNELRNLNDNLK